jgi:hypothetical protein
MGANSDFGGVRGAPDPQVLAMDSNNLSGEIPAAINELEALEYLNLRGNQYHRPHHCRLLP